MTLPIAWRAALAQAIVLAWIAAATMACGLLDDFTRDGPGRVEAFLAENPGGLCLDEYNEMVNLCGDVEFCFDERIQRTYPEGLSIDVGFHWDGGAGLLLDVGGDCDGHRVSIWTDAMRALHAGFAGHESATAPDALSPGAHLVSFRASVEGHALFLDGRRVAGTDASSSIPMLLPSCGPGFVLGNRLSYWWEIDKVGKWLRHAPFFVHLRAKAESLVDFDATSALTSTPETVALFRARGIEGRDWRSEAGDFTGRILEGASFVPDVARDCFRGNQPPEQPQLEVQPTEPVEGEAVRCGLSAPLMDPDGDPVTVDFRWQTSTGTIAPGPELSASAARAFDVWTCVGTARDPIHRGRPGILGIDIRAAEPCHTVTFTSTSAAVALSSSGLAFGSSPFTIELWVRVHGRVPDLPRSDLLQIGGSTTAADAESLLAVELSAGGEITCGVRARATDRSGNVVSTRIDDGSWHHIACEHGNGALTMYTDGVKGAPLVRSIFVHPEGPVRLGAYPGSNPAWAAPVSIGPLRISRIARYSDDFRPSSRWTADSNAVVLLLNERGLEGSRLEDELGNHPPGVATQDVHGGGRCER